MAPTTRPACDWIKAQSDPNTAHSNSPGVFSVWRRLTSSADALRQRVVLALSEIFVVSLLQLNSYYPGQIAAA